LAVCNVAGLAQTLLCSAASLLVKQPSHHTAIGRFIGDRCHYHCGAYFDANVGGSALLFYFNHDSLKLIARAELIGFFLVLAES
jgi:hypothetical protein